MNDFPKYFPKNLSLQLFWLFKKTQETKSREKKMNKRQRKKAVWRDVDRYWYRDHYAVEKSNNRWRRCYREREEYEVENERLKDKVEQLMNELAGYIWDEMRSSAVDQKKKESMRRLRHR